MDKNITQSQKVRDLAAKVREAIVPLVDRDYVLYGLPYHNNIGDTLIWEGELALLNKLPHRCLDRCGWNAYPDVPVRGKNVMILIHGGGYMGDVWRRGWEQVLECLRMNQDRKIVLLPNTLHYSDKFLVEGDAAIISACKDLILCMRDSRSLQLAREYFPDVKSVLVPDMAFCINPDNLRRWMRSSSDRTLLLKRLDKELSAHPIPEAIMSLDPEVRDWPTLERLLTGEKWFLRVLRRIDRLGHKAPAIRKWRDFLYSVWYRPMMTKVGVSFVSSYARIYTTRLHVMILSVLLGREVHLIDNSYGKLSTFYHTWLEDCQDTYIYQE